MAETAGRAEIVLEVTNFITLLWEDIEKNEGRGAADFFFEDGVFDSKMVCFTGRQEIRSWFAWRTEKVRTARHLLSNFHYDFSHWDSDQEVEVRAIMVHYGADGRGVLPVGLPIGIYDHKTIVRRGGEHGWLIRLLQNDPVFLAPDHVALQYQGNGSQIDQG
jgi:hypothetical protein